MKSIIVFLVTVTAINLWGNDIHSLNAFDNYSSFQMARSKERKIIDNGTQTPSPSEGSSLVSDAESSTYAPNAQSEFDLKLESLASQIATSFSGAGKVKIAVFNFVDLQGGVSQLGMFLAEELITRLFKSGSFEVVERRLLDKVLEEQKMSTTGLLDISSAQKIGNILGVNAIVTGTVTDLQSSVKINARIIGADTGAVTAAAGETINKDSDVTRLLSAFKPAQSTGTNSSTSRPDPTLSSSTPGTTQTTSGANSASDVFYREDFTTVIKGYIPSGWVGGDTFAVKDSLKQPGRNVLATTTPGPHSFVIQNIPFTDNWMWEVQMKIDITCCEPVTFDLGDLSIGFHTNGDSWFHKSLFRWDDDEFCHQVIVFSIEKKGDVFRVMINGKEYSLVRIAGFKKPSTFRFGFRDEDQEACAIYKIMGRSL